MTPIVAHSKPFARASLLLLGLAWTLPFLQPYHRIPLTAFYNEWLAFGLGLAAALLLATRQAWHEAQVPVVALAPPALALLLGLQAASGLLPYPEQAVTATYYLLWASLMTLLGGVLARELGMTAVAETLAWFVLAGGALSALCAFAQHYHLLPEFDFLVTRKVIERVYGNIGQSNHYAAYIAMALCSTAYLLGSGRLRTAWAAAWAVLLLPALALSGSRGAWLYFGILAVLAWLLRCTHRDAGSRRLLVYVLCLLPGFVIAGFVIPYLGDPAYGQFTSAQRLFESVAGASPRIQLMTEAWELFLSAPAFGAGWGQFPWGHFTYMAASGATAAPGVFNHAHNIVLHLMAETGVAGMLVVCGAASLWLVGLRRIGFNQDWWWTLGLLGILGAHSMLEFPLWYSYFLGMAAVLLGIGAQHTVRLRLAGFARLTVTVLMLAGWFNLLSALPAYRAFERLVFIPGASAAVQGDQQAFVEEVARLHREPLLAPYVELAVAYSVSVNEDRLKDKLELVARAMRFAPVSYVVHRHTLLLALAGEREAALRQLDQVARAYPEQLREFYAELEGYARDRPEIFRPLLEAAATRLQECRVC